MRPLRTGWVPLNLKGAASSSTKPAGEPAGAPANAGAPMSPCWPKPAASGLNALTGAAASEGPAVESLGDPAGGRRDILRSGNVDRGNEVLFNTLWHLLIMRGTNCAQMCLGGVASVRQRGYSANTIKQGERSRNTLCTLICI